MTTQRQSPNPAMFWLAVALGVALATPGACVNPPPPPVCPPGSVCPPPDRTPLVTPRPDEAGYRVESPVDLPIDCANPDLQADSRGGLHLLCRAGSDKTARLYYLSSSNSGATWSSPELVPGSTGADHEFNIARAAIHEDSSGSVRVHAFWGLGRRDKWRTLLYNTRAPGGTWLTKAEEVARGGAKTTFGWLDVAANSSGRVVVVSQRYEGVPNQSAVWAWVREPGAGWSTGQEASPSRPEWRDATVFADPSGVFHLVACAGGAASVYKRLSPESTSWKDGPALSLPGGTVGLGDVALHRNQITRTFIGYPFLLVYVSRLSDAKWSIPVALTTSPAQPNFGGKLQEIKPRMAVDALGNAFVTHLQSPSAWAVAHVFEAATGTWAAQEVLSAGVGTDVVVGDGPTVAAYNGTGYFVYREGERLRLVRIVVDGQ